MTEGEEMQEVENFACFAMDKMTLATGNMMGNMLVQVSKILCLLRLMIKIAHFASTIYDR